MLLEEGWGYSAGVGGSCSTHNLRPVDPHPRGVDRLEAGRASADVEPPPGGCAGTRRQPERARSEARLGKAGPAPGVRRPDPPTLPGRLLAARPPGARAPGATAKTL